MIFQKKNLIRNHFERGNVSEVCAYNTIEIWLMNGWSIEPRKHFIRILGYDLSDFVADVAQIIAQF